MEDLFFGEGRMERRTSTQDIEKIFYDEVEIYSLCMIDKNRYIELGRYTEAEMDPSLSNRLPCPSPKIDNN